MKFYRNEHYLKEYDISDSDYEKVKAVALYELEKRQDKEEILKYCSLDRWIMEFLIEQVFAHSDHLSERTLFMDNKFNYDFEAAREAYGICHF